MTVKALEAGERMNANVCWVDTETTGLHAYRHEIWEVGLITPDGSEHHWFLPVEHLANADPIGLGIGRFHERHPQGNNRLSAAGAVLDHPLDFALTFAALTHGRHLAGAVVSFDEERLRRLLWRHNVSPSWSYHLIDVEALAVGFIAGCRRAFREGRPEVAWAGKSVLRACEGPDAEPPWDSNELSRSVGVNPDDFERHTALGDCRWSAALFKAVMGRG